jgi:hypothetical protein
MLGQPLQMLLPPPLVGGVHGGVLASQELGLRQSINHSSTATAKLRYCLQGSLALLFEKGGGLTVR